MPYNVGSKGSHGCSGYPVVDEKGKVVGCHPTRDKAVNHLQALYANVPDARGKFDGTGQEIGDYNPPIPSPLQNTEGIIECQYDGCGCSTCMKLNVCCDACPDCQANEMKSDCCPDLNKKSPCWDGYVQRGMKEQNGKMVPNCVPVNKKVFEGFGRTISKTERLTGW